MKSKYCFFFPLPAIFFKPVFVVILLIFNYTDILFAQNGGKYNPLSKVTVYVDKGKVILNAFKANRFSEPEYNSQFRNIRIYRLSCPDFVFSTDYEEFFDNLDINKSNLIFNGWIKPLLDCKFSFSDTTAEIGSTYAYWIASSEGEPLGPFPVKVRDTEVWWPYRSVIEKVENLKRAYPTLVTIDTIGYSVSRKPMLALKIGKGKASLALVGAIHAGEAGPELIIPVIEKLLKQNPEILDKTSVLAIPSVNCDQRDKLVQGNPWYLRRNANLVDLNRNFPAGWEQVDLTYGYKTSDPDGLTYRGPYAASEPETVAVVNYLKKNKPRVLFSFHCLAGICGEDLLGPKIALEDHSYTGLCNHLAKLYWEGIDVQLTKNRQVNFECNSGSLPTWCFCELGIPSFDMEAPVDAKDRAQCVVDHTDRLLLEKYQEIHYKGFVSLLKGLI